MKAYCLEAAGFTIKKVDINNIIELTGDRKTQDEVNDPLPPSKKVSGDKVPCDQHECCGMCFKSEFVENILIE